ncbi:MAG: L,D-transpeptidase [Pseudomonadota bacterium]|nr:L,D-transpeptidase [Pseudomonadota bacterium]
MHIEIRLRQQELWLLAGRDIVRGYSVSTAKNGPGEMENSECTPRGWHAICEKIGAGCASGTVFVARQPDGKVYVPEFRTRYPGKDWILTRILWLTGLQPAFNQGGSVDTKNRFIYIHGAPDDVAMGTRGSGGCIRMRNADVIDLFDRVEVGTRVRIRDDAL